MILHQNNVKGSCLFTSASQRIYEATVVQKNANPTINKANIAAMALTLLAAEAVRNVPCACSS
jgi:hypothetical protein